MDFGNTGLLISGMVASALGAGVFLYGKKQGNPKCILTGLGMSIYPFLVPSALVTWLLTGACLAGLYFLPSGE